MKEHVWIDSERFEDENSKIKKVLKNGVLQISFTGLNEALIVLNENGHESSMKSQELGFKIVEFLANKTKEYVERYNLNFVLSGNENLEVSKYFVEIDRVIFGKVKGVTDKDFYINSFVFSNDIENTIKCMYKYGIGYGVIKYIE